MTTLPDLPSVLWLDTCGEYKPEPPLQSDVRVDNAIIGVGFICMIKQGCFTVRGV